MDVGITPGWCCWSGECSGMMTSSSSWTGISMQVLPLLILREMGEGLLSSLWLSGSMAVKSLFDSTRLDGRDDGDGTFTAMAKKKILKKSYYSGKQKTKLEKF